MFHLGTSYIQNICLQWSKWLGPKGFFDAETERDNYLSGTKDQKLQLIKEIMQALESIQNTGVHGIFLVVKRGRIDLKDKEIIDNLGKYVFNDDMKKKVYLVFTSSSMKYCKNKQEGIGKNMTFRAQSFTSLMADLC